MRKIVVDIEDGLAQQLDQIGRDEERFGRPLQTNAETVVAALVHHARDRLAITEKLDNPPKLRVVKGRAVRSPRRGRR